MGRFSLAGAAALAFASALSPVGAASAETLPEALAAAWNGNPTLKSKRAQLRATDEGVAQARAGWLPSVTLNADAARGDYGNSTNSPPMPRHILRTQRDYGATISQPLYSGGRTVSAQRQADDSVKAGRAVLAATESQVLLGAATAFLNVARDQKLVELAASNERVLEKQLAATADRFRVGDITGTDVRQAEARCAQAKADRISAEGALENSKAAFEGVVGRPPESPKLPDGLVSVPASLGELRDLAQASNPNVVAAEWTAKAADEAVDQAFADLLPSLSASASYGRGLNGITEHSQTQTSQVMLTLTIPLYDGGLASSKTRAQKHTAAQRRLEVDQARMDAVQAAVQGWQALAAGTARAEAVKAQIRAGELALAGVREESLVGSRTVLDTLNAEQELFNARSSLVSAERDRMVAALQIRAASGGLTAEAMGLDVVALDPGAHLDRVRGTYWGTSIDD